MRAFLNLNEAVFPMNHGPTEQVFEASVGITTLKELTVPLPCLNINQRASSAVICYQQLLGTFSGNQALFFLQGDARTG